MIVIGTECKLAFSQHLTKHLLPTLPFRHYFHSGGKTKGGRRERRSDRELHHMNSERKHAKQALQWIMHTDALIVDIYIKLSPYHMSSQQ